MQVEQPRVEAVYGDRVEEGVRGEDRNEVGVVGAGMDRVAQGRDDPHEIAATAENGKRHAPADGLTQDRQIGRHPEVALGALGAGAVAGENLVKDQDDPASRGLGAQ